VSARIQQAEALLSAFDWDVAHCRHVRDLALQLFDQLRPLHQLTDTDRELLAAAALLHDIGWTISHKKHHKHSYRLIHESRRVLAGFTANEVELIANVARYHRKALPAQKHEAFAGLNAGDQSRVRYLAGMLRVADGLDRPHRQFTTQIRCSITDRELQITVNTGAMGGSRKRDLLEEVIGRPVTVGEFTVS
jgi:exopolyphosphatase/guanosine-5'-triphosphate,3'-diphosphate pyrophosphatase